MLRLSCFFVILITLSARAEIDPLCYTKGTCQDGSGDGRTYSSASPSTGNSIRLNPAAVPTEKGFGFEVLYYDDADLSIVQGLGRAGAALSPANSEETFFGPPSIEESDDYLKRKIENRKYESQTYTLATALRIYKNKKSGLSKFDLNLGLMGKYNKHTAKISPGSGVTGSWGPVQFGYSYYIDETQLSLELEKNARPEATRYNVQSYNIGVFLASIILSYSNLQMNLVNGHQYATDSIWMGSLFYRRTIFSLAWRSENSQRQWYNSELKTLEDRLTKNDYFVGLQFKATKNLMIGAFYNYYLLREGSLSATLFF